MECMDWCRMIEVKTSGQYNTILGTTNKKVWTESFATEIECWVMKNGCITGHSQK